jgi:hypothetical protein
MEPYDVKSIPIVVYRRERTMTKKNLTVIILSLITMIAFSVFDYTLKNIFGDIAMIALIYVAIMFGSGMLTEVNFSSFFDYCLRSLILILSHGTPSSCWVEEARSERQWSRLVSWSVSQLHSPQVSNAFLGCG